MYMLIGSMRTLDLNQNDIFINVFFVLWIFIE
jgi:hypothetical protein